MAKNLCARTRPMDKPYEVWQAGDWTWNVLKKWQADDDKPFARYFCNVVTPICPNGELGDVYASDIKGTARLVWRDPELEKALAEQAAKEVSAKPELSGEARGY